MAYLAASTNKGTRKQVNEDACCVMAAQTPLGEVLMAVVCDGVGGLAKGNVASSTVIDRFARWFEDELPLLMEGVAEAGRFDFGLVKIVWEAQLQGLNELIRTHGTKTGARLGTTFTGIIACNGHYLAGHVGDCRAFKMTRTTFEQITEDQTLVAKRLAAGEITAEEAARAPKNVILQAVGSQRTLKPVFTEGTFAADELIVICCDGAYHKADNDGIRKLFQRLDYRDEAALQQACDMLLQFDMDCGEKDNLTVVAVSGDLAMHDDVRMGDRPLQPSSLEVAGSYERAEGDTPPAGRREGADEDDLATMVEPEESGEDELPTMVEAEEDLDEDDAPTMVEAEEDLDEDDAPTMVADYEEENAGLAFSLPSLDDEDDAPTMVAEDDGDEDDAPTMVADEPEPALSEEGAQAAALAMLLGGSSVQLGFGDDDEDDAPTMVADDPDPDPDPADQDDLPTMVASDEGGDA